MGRRVVVVASGVTELRALPHLLRSVCAEGVTLVNVRIPPRHQALRLAMVTKLIRAEWFSSATDERPDKFVVLVDADRRSVEDAVAPFADLSDRLPDIRAPILVTAAKWHLEAWFFADSKQLRVFLGRDLGSVDVSAPDAIEDPKKHLRNLLGESALYTARTCERIAEGLRADALRISPSFRKFEQAVRNGAGTGAESD